MRYLLVITLLLFGCQSKPVRHVAETPSVVVGPTGEVKLDGDSPNPAKVNTSSTASIMPVPEGSTFVFNEKLGTMVLTVSKATQIALNRKETAVQGPVAFTPDKAPTIGDEKKAEADKWVTLGLYAAVFIGGASAIFGLVKDWNLVMYGGIATLAGGLFGLFVERHPLLLLLIGFGIALKFAGPIIWHTTVKPLINAEPSK